MKSAVPHEECTPPPPPVEIIKEKLPYYHSTIKEKTKNRKFYVDMPKFIRDSENEIYEKKKQHP